MPRLANERSCRGKMGPGLRRGDEWRRRDTFTTSPTRRCPSRPILYSRGLRGGGRPRDRVRRGRSVHIDRRMRPRGEPAADPRPEPWRHRAGDRPGAPGGVRVRRTIRCRTRCPSSSPRSSIRSCRRTASKPWPPSLPSPPSNWPSGGSPGVGRDGGGLQSAWTAVLRRRPGQRRSRAESGHLKGAIGRYAHPRRLERIWPLGPYSLASSAIIRSPLIAANASFRLKPTFVLFACPLRFVLPAIGAL
jgi:hypothetical protein